MIQATRTYVYCYVYFLAHEIILIRILFWHKSLRVNKTRRYQKQNYFLFYYKLNILKFIAMRYYKFNRDRSLDPLQKYRKSCRKLSYNASCQTPIISIIYS
jgi:hypothetical protein